MRSRPGRPPLVPCLPVSSFPVPCSRGGVTCLCRPFCRVSPLRTGPGGSLPRRPDSDSGRGRVWYRSETTVNIEGLTSVVPGKQGGFPRTVVETRNVTGEEPEGSRRPGTGGIVGRGHRGRTGELAPTYDSVTPPCSRPQVSENGSRTVVTSPQVGCPRRVRTRTTVVGRPTPPTSTPQTPSPRLYHTPTTRRTSQDTR